MNKRLCAVAFVALTSAWLAPPAAAQQYSGIITGHYNVTSASYQACKTIGTGSPIQQPIALPAPVKTSGSNTTFTAVTAGTGPFTGLAAGDVLILPTSTAGTGRTQMRSIITWTSADTVVVDTAYDLGTSSVLSRYKQLCGGGDDDGWTNVKGLINVGLQIQIFAQNTATGIDMVVECRASQPSSLPTQVYPDNSAGAAKRTYTTADIQARTIVAVAPQANCAEVRARFKLNTAGTSTSIDVFLSADKRTSQ
jgi:hypothetical protein